jgi:hypothetical protein
MFDPSSITLGQMSSAVRDLSIVGTLVLGSWKVRGAYEAVTHFFDRVTKHMDVVENNISVLMTNHLSHIEDSLKQMSVNQERVLSGRDAIHVIDEEASGK